MTEPDYVLYENRGPAAWITLNRPDKRNAMTFGMATQLGVLLERARVDDAATSVVITGAGAAFTAGLDRAEIAKGLDEKSPFPVELLVHFPKPTIAAVNGLAYGGGATMAMACDLRVASETATFTFGLAKVGLVPEWGSSYLLWRQIGYSRALDVMLTARTIGSEEALQMGLVNRVVAADSLLSAVDELTSGIASLPVGTAPAVKEVLRDGLDADFATARINEMTMVTRRSRALRAARKEGRT